MEVRSGSGSGSGPFLRPVFVWLSSPWLIRESPWEAPGQGPSFRAGNPDTRIILMCVVAVGDPKSVLTSPLGG
jgi:hypothetical protein